jgi:hypothetical protein
MSDEDHLHAASIGSEEPSRMIEAWGEALERKDPEFKKVSGAAGVG